jgi:uncharacterized membrane protein YphA (DoxX/SURF4 family)
MRPVQSLASEMLPSAIILIRLMAGAVFFSEGIQKYLFPETVGVGRFIKIGSPAPEILAPFVGAGRFSKRDYLERTREQQHA